MGFYVGTKVSSTNPDLLASGSTFNQEWSDFIVSVENGVTYYHCRKEYLNEALSELSKTHPNVMFSGYTWIDDNYENAIDFTFILKNGSYEYVYMAPHYQIFFPVIEDEVYKKLAKRFSEQIFNYLNRLDLVKKDSKEGAVFDFLNDKEDNDGFKSYFTITWENDKHIFRATKRYTSQVIVDYQRKKTENADSKKQQERSRKE